MGRLNIKETIVKLFAAYGLCALSAVFGLGALYLVFEYSGQNSQNISLLYGVALCVASLAGLSLYQTFRTRRLRESREETLKLLEERMVALEAAQDGIGIVDQDGCLTYMNAALMNLHGIKSDDAHKYIGRPWSDLYTDKGRQDIKKHVMPALVEQGYWYGEAPIKKEDGSILIAEMSITRLPDGSAIGTARDVTNRKLANQEKEELEGQFYQAQKMEAVGRLAGGIAHDFNNILAAMNGYAEFLFDDLDEGSEQRKFAQNILKAGRQASALVDQMLAFSRRNEKTMLPMKMRTPLKECVSMLQASMPKSIEFKHEIDTGEHAINGNATQIAQVVMNLCVNAIDAMENERGELTMSLDVIDTKDYALPEFLVDGLPDGGKTPPIRIEELGSNRTRMFLNNVSSQHKYVCLSVCDTGSGMSKGVMEHVFEPFFTTKAVDKGTGLGLATVHGVMVSHQGALILDSVVGEGTCFYLLFPLSEQGEKEEELLSFQRNVSHEEACVLLVEDQEEVRDMMMNMLSRLGYDAYCCDTGLEALEILKENPDSFDLVITDHNMPKMTGVELIQEAGQLFPDLPFILVSGYSQQKLEDMLHEHPAVKSLLRKPVSAQDLSDKIEEVLTGRGTLTGAAEEGVA